MVRVTLLRCSFIGWPSTLNSSSRKGPMLANVEANSSALQSCTLISRKPKDSARAECRAADGPISARRHSAGELLPTWFCTGTPGTEETRRQREEAMRSLHTTTSPSILSTLECIQFLSWVETRHSHVGTIFWFTGIYTTWEIMQKVFISVLWLQCSTVYIKGMWPIHKICKDLFV